MQEDNNNRKFQRINFKTPVLVSNEKNNWNGELVDLSLKGLLIQFEDEWIENENELYSLRICFQRTTSNEYDISMKIKPVHKNGNLIGFEWKDIDLDSFSGLRRIIELQLGDQMLINREISALGDLSK